MELYLIIVLTLTGGFFSLIGSYVISLKKNWNANFSIRLVSFSAGVLISTALIDLMPEAIQVSKDPKNVFIPLLIGILFLFFMERFIILYHHHHEETHEIKPSGYLILFGDSVHNFIDGVATATAFLTSPMLGLITTIAVSAHELPQEISDFSILVSSGFSRKKAMFYNILSSFSSVLGGITSYFLFKLIEPYVYVVLSFTAGTFLYIACSDIIPELHRETREKNQLIQSLTLGIGVLLTFLVKYIVERFIS